MKLKLTIPADAFTWRDLLIKILIAIVAVTSIGLILNLK